MSAPHPSRRGRRREVIPWRSLVPETTGAVERGKRRLTGVGIALSVVLVALKGYAGVRSGSTAVISDALNSTLDIFSYTALFVSVRFQSKPADLTHHYGHHRAEPMAGLLIAILAAVLGGIVLRDATLKLISPTLVESSPLATGVVVFAIASKVCMSILYRRARGASRSPALQAAAVDSRNDAFASGVALFGLLAGGTWDSIAGMAIGVWIIVSGARIGLENIGFLMGRAPSAEVLAGLGEIARTVPGVIDTNNIRAHYVGNYLHVEVHIEVDENLPIRKAHDIAKAVGQRLEQLSDVHVVFVHTDPVPAPRPATPDDRSPE